MCEQTEVEYLDGDVVWVKLGPCWWPGEVREFGKLPIEIVKDFKKPPIAVVKFFDEDQYEYVKNINHIYKYSCRRKNEFIKKGLDMHRAKIAFMDKFPADVCHAEALTGGDPDIITNDEFGPEQKPRYAEIFGTPNSKKTPKTGNKGRPSTGSSPRSSRPAMSPQRRITHPRFIGQSDHEIRILEQSTPVAPSSHYTCHICGFESSRLNVIVLHNRSHSNGTYVSPSKQKTKKSSKKGKRKSFATTNSIDEDLELIRQGVTTGETSESETEEVDKDKRKTGNKRKNNKAANNSSKKAKVSNICNNLLADWGDSDEDTETEKTDETATPNDPEKPEKTEANKSVQNELLADWEDKNTDDDESTRNSTAVSDEKKPDVKASEKSSCFDFDDEEENAVLEKSPGRKIPRVIPAKRISKDTDDKTDEEKVEITEMDSSENDKDEKKESKEPDLAAFKNLLEETEVPDFTSLPDVGVSIDKKDKKSDETIDKTNGVMKSKEPESETAKDNMNIETCNKDTESVVVTVPKKRIVRNFEEFENLLNEQKNADDDSTKSKSTLEVSKLKSQLMSKLTESPKKEVPVERIETPEPEPEPDSEVDSKMEEDESQSNESFQKKISQSESEDTDIDKKDNTSVETTKDVDSETPDVDDSILMEEKSEEPKEELTETIEKEVEEKKDEEPVLEDVSEKTEVCEDEPMELDTITQPPVEEEKIDEPITEEIIAEEKIEKHIVEETVVEEKDIEEEKQPVVEEELIHEKIQQEEPETPQPEPETPQLEPETLQPEPETLHPEPEILQPEPEMPQPEPEPLQPEPEPEPEITEIEEQKIVEEIPEVQETQDLKPEDTRSQKIIVDISDICIDNADNLSGLSTLAAVSELTGNLYDKQETIVMESETKDDTSTIDEVTNPPSSVSVTDDTESRDLTPVQDELSEPVKPVKTLANFSMDFSDSNSESTIIKTVTQEDVIPEKITDQVETSVSTIDSEESKIEICEIEKPAQTVTDVPTEFETIESEIEKITSIETNSDKLNSFPENISQVPQDCISIETSGITYSDFQLADTGTSVPGTDSSDFITKMNETVVTTETTLESEIAKLTDTHPDAENVVPEQQQNTSSSKLLEILTDSKKSEHAPVGRTIITSGGNQKVQMVISGDSKISKKFDPKTSKFVIKSATPKGSAKSNKPIILSEKIIKPVTEIENVSVKKVTSKRTYQDVEDIDTFIIQKPTKKSNTGELDQQDIILTPKSEALKFKTGLQRGRGKPKIIEQTIIKAADVVPATSESQNLLDDSMFDINSMPIVLSDQILTPESIENIPMVMTDLMPTSTVSTTTVQTVITEKPQQQTMAVKRGGAMQQVKLLNKGKVTSQTEPSKFGQNVIVSSKNMPRGLGKNQKVYQTGSKTLKNNPAVITQPGKPGKFIILPSSTTTTTGVSKYTVGKRLTTIKSSTAVTNPTTSKQLKSVQNTTGEPTGNKIMIVTNQQGVQSRVLLTPAQQKLLGCKVPGTKMTKTSQIKGGIMQKSILTSKGTIIGSVNSGLKSSNLTSQTIMTSKGQMVTTQPGQMLVTSEGQVLTPITQQQLKSNMHKAGQKIKIQSSRVILPEKSGDNSQKAKMNIMGTKTKTVLIKGAQGQTLKKIQASASESKNILLSQAGHKSQLLSIGGQQISSGLSGKQVVVTSKGQLIKPDGKVGIPKQSTEKLQRVQPPKTSTPPRIMTKPRTQMLLSPKQQISSSVAIPPLAPITGQVKKDVQSPPKPEQKLVTESKEKAVELPTGTGEQKQPNQLIIQDAMGNQTTVTEGQILALPSGETVDGQPQSYVLVTVDETGNLVPISNDTLMSLDPSFAAGGDMNNIVLQIDPGAQENQAQEAKPAETPLPAAELPVEEQLVTNQQLVETTEQQQLLVDNQQLMLPEQSVLPAVTAAETQLVAPEQQQVLQEPESFVANTEETQVITSDAANLLQDTQQTAVACSINNGDSSQQLIITGDPESTQKFLASLTEGNTDLSSLLSGTDGNIIINTDGQQILLNTDSENQILLSVNSDNLGLIQSSTETDPTQNSMFVTQQAIKNQDILAAALADTDVFQQEAAEKISTSQTLPKVSSSAQSQLSPNSSLYPMNVGNVLETSLTLGSPIMTPLEVPSVNNKKINTDVESTLITQVPSSLELPITITDPSISQTVSQQVMLGNDLQSNLELPISMSDNPITSIRSSEMNSPNFVYSLPTLDDNLEQKTSFIETSTTDNIYNTSLTGSMSMPLLTEEPEIQPVEQEQIPTTHEETPIVTSVPETSTTETIITESGQSESFPTLTTENLSTTVAAIPIEEELGLNSTDICSSLSEPPPGMFDKNSFSNFLNKSEEENETDPLPRETDSPAETATPTSETCVLNEQMNSLPILTDGAEPNPETEAEAGSSDMLPTSSAVTEKSAEESNLDMDCGVSESSDQQSISETVMAQEVPRSELSETPNSDLNSPRLDIDENSVEIPIQPPIITNLSETFPENAPENYNSHDDCNSKKRVSEDADDDTENDAKRTKLSCD